jgi:NodT family efflux transporter outer membrane factor (OMF) lipoprotein
MSRSNIKSRDNRRPDIRRPAAPGRKAGRRSKLILTAGLVLISLGIWGCALGPDFVPPAAPEVTGYTQGQASSKTIAADGKQQQFEWGAKISRAWWHLFQSDKLDRVIKLAVANNQNLQAAQARLRESQANLQAGYGVFFPQIEGKSDITRQKFNSASFGGSGSGTLFTVYSASAAVSYNFDFFGRSRRTVEGLKAQSDYQDYEARATYLSLLGRVINTVIAEASYRAQIKATREIIGDQQHQLDIMEAQVKAGIIASQDVLSMRARLASTVATLPPLQQSLDQARHLLATLVGQIPSAWTPPEVGFADFTLPEHLPVSLPSDLVRQRPDILAAEAQLHVASADIGVATANMFPSIDLTGAYGQSTIKSSLLFNPISNFWNLGVGLTAPLFQGGTLWYKRKAALAAYDSALADYRQTVLAAFAQVADTLRALEHDAQTLNAQSQALESSQQSLKLVQENYKAGKADYVQVLIADLQYQQARIGYLTAKAQRYQDSATLIAALGGGWWNAQPESGAAKKAR